MTFKREIVDLILLGEVLPVVYVIVGNLASRGALGWDVVFAPILFLPGIVAAIVFVKLCSLPWRLRQDPVTGLSIRDVSERPAFGAIWHFAKAACVLLSLPTVEGLSRFGSNAMLALPVAAAYALVRYGVDMRREHQLSVLR